jgi:sulfide dehydrogenase cytochrome subunit
MRFTFSLTATLVLAFSSHAFAQSSPTTAPPAAASTALHQRTLAATCANCHGTDGRSAEGASVPSLAGQPQATLAAQLKAFKDGSRPGTIMPQLARGLSETQIDQLASYFAALKR